MDSVGTKAALRNSMDKGASPDNVLSSEMCSDSRGFLPMSVCHFTKAATALMTGASMSPRSDQAGSRYLFGVAVTGGSFGVYLDASDPSTVVAALGRQAGRMSAPAVPYPPAVVEGPYAMLYDIRLTTAAP